MTTTIQTKTLQVWWELASGIHWLVVNGEPFAKFPTDEEARETGNAWVENSVEWTTELGATPTRYVWL